MSIVVDLSPADEAAIRREAAQNGMDAAEFARALLERELLWRRLRDLQDRPRPARVSDLRPRIPSAPGTSWTTHVAGQWPGDESDEEVARALEALS